MAGGVQLQNQVAMRTMLKQAEEELTVKLKLPDDPLKKQRMEVDEERHRYEVMEEGVLLQLG